MRRVLIDTTMQIVMVSDVPIVLTRTQFDLLEYLARNPFVIRSRDQIRDAIDFKMDNEDRSIDTHIKRIRLAGLREEIKTKYCFGYYWAAPRPIFRDNGKKTAPQPEQNSSILALQTDGCESIDHADAALDLIVQPYVRIGWRITTITISKPTDADPAHGFAILTKAD